MEAISIQTYKQFAKKYKIPLRVMGKTKDIKILMSEIKLYEKNNKIKGGLYY